MYDNKPSIADWLLMLLLAIVWGASFIFIKRAVEIYEPIQMAMWRMVLAMLVYLPFAFIYWKKINWKNWKYYALVAFLGSAIPNFLFAVAQQHIDSSLAGVLNSLAPLFTLMIGLSFFSQRFNTIQLVGVLIGFVGAVILITGNKSSGSGSNWIFAALCALGPMCYAINSIMVKKYLQDEHPAALAAGSFMVTGILFIAGLWWSGGIEVAINHPKGFAGLGYILYLAGVGTALASIGYFRLIQRTGALFATSVTYLIPITAMILGAIDGELLGWADYLGMGVILTGIYLTRN